MVTGAKERGKDIRDFGTDMYTLLYFKWITNKNLLYSTGNAALSYMAAWMRGEFGAEWIHVYVWLSCYAVHLNYHNIINRLYSNIREGNGTLL